jgi:hypothetical protein
VNLLDHWNSLAHAALKANPPTDLLTPDHRRALRVLTERHDAHGGDLLTTFLRAIHCFGYENNSVIYAINSIRTAFERGVASKRHVVAAVLDFHARFPLAAVLVAHLAHSSKITLSLSPLPIRCLSAQLRAICRRMGDSTATAAAITAIPIEFAVFSSVEGATTCTPS